MTPRKCLRAGIGDRGRDLQIHAECHTESFVVHPGQ